MEKNTSIWKNTLTNGVILGLVLIIYTVLLYITDLTFNTGMGVLVYVILIAGIFIGTKSYRDKVLDGSISYGKALTTGVLISVFAAIIISVFIYILYKWIDPGLMDKIVKMKEDKMLDRGMSADQVEQAMNMAKKFMSPLITMIGSIISYVLIGTIISLVTSAILKKEKNPMIEETES
jgi:hypothetical protein